MSMIDGKVEKVSKGKGNGTRVSNFCCYRMKARNELTTGGIYYLVVVFRFFFSLSRMRDGEEKGHEIHLIFLSLNVSHILRDADRQSSCKIKKIFAFNVVCHPR